MDNVELKQYEQGNFSSIYIGAKPIIKFAMLRLENFISYYLRGPGGLDYKSEVHDVESYAREIFYIEQADANKIENWIVYYDDEHNCMAIRHCFWNKALDREQIMNEESLRVAVREQCIVDSIPHIQNETVIGVNEIDKNNILNRCLIEKREQKPTLTYIWSNKNDLTLEEQDVYNQLKDKKMRYPNRSIIVKVK